MPKDPTVRKLTLVTRTYFIESCIVCMDALLNCSDSKRKDIGSALVFNVPDVQETLTRVLATKEAEMDGPVQYDLEGNKVRRCILGG